MLAVFRPDTEFYIDEGCYIVEIHNGDADPGCSIARARLPVGCATKPHMLTGIVERYVILQGEGIVQVGDAEPAMVRPLDVVIIDAGVRQSIRNTGTEDLLFLCVCTPRFRQSAYIALR